MANEFMVTCRKCRGSGRVKQSAFGGRAFIEKPCRHCRGTGLFHDKDAHIKHLQAQLDTYRGAT